MPDSAPLPIGRWVGIDHGRKRIGLAISDARARIASPADVLAARDNPRADAEALTRWAAAHDPIGFVVGLPLNMDESEGPQARLVRVFAAALKECSGKPVELWDERLSSFQADEHLSAADIPPARRAALRDKLAAQAILQGFLDARRSAP